MNATTKILAMPDVHPVRRKPRIMIAGEFSAGKSRLVNALLGKEVLPSNVTSTALPPIWMVHGDQPPLIVGIDGEVMDLEMDEIKVETTAFCVVSSRAPILEHVDLIDTPGNSDPKIPAICWERMVQYADSMVWCTSAMQAWKQTEKATCADLPEDLLTHATLLITQADRMPDERSAGKVERRVTRDASKYFSTIMMGSMLDENDAAMVRERLISISGDLALRGAEEELVDEIRAEPAGEAEAWTDDWQEETVPAVTGSWVEEDEAELAGEAATAEALEDEPEVVLATPVIDGFADETEGSFAEAEAEPEASGDEDEADAAFAAGGSFTPDEEAADIPAEDTATAEDDAPSSDGDDAVEDAAEPPPPRTRRSLRWPKQTKRPRPRPRTTPTPTPTTSPRPPSWKPTPRPRRSRRTRPPRQRRRCRISRRTPTRSRQTSGPPWSPPSPRNPAYRCPSDSPTARSPGCGAGSRRMPNSPTTNAS